MFKSIRKFLTYIATAMTFMAVAMMLLSGCKSIDDTSFDDPEEAAEALVTRPESDYTYIPQYISLPQEMDRYIDLDFYDGKIYFVTAKYGEPDENNYITESTYSICSMSLDGAELRKLPQYSSPAPPATDGVNTNSGISAINIDDTGCIWVSEWWNHYKFNLPGDFDPKVDASRNYVEYLENGIVLRKLDDTGAELLSIDIGSIEGLEGRSPEEMATRNSLNAEEGADSGEEHIYLIYETHESNTYTINTYAVVLDNTGSVLFNKNCGINQTYEQGFPQMNRGFVKMPDGSMALLAGAENEFLLPIDVASGIFGEAIDLTQIVEREQVHIGTETRIRAPQFTACDSNKGIIARATNSLSVVRPEDMQAVLLFDFYESGFTLDGSIEKAVILPDGSISLLRSVWTGTEDRYDLVVLQRVLRSELAPEKTVLTLASLGMSRELSEAVSDFNMKSQDCYIEVVDYWEKGESWFDVLDYLLHEVIAGDAPDMLCFENFPFAYYAKSGLFADLYPFVDADSELQRSDLAQSPLLAAEIDGKLYWAYSSFAVSTIMGSPTVVGDGMGWTFDDIKAVLDANPDADIPLGDQLTLSRYLRDGALDVAISGFIDWETGKCSFDSPQFVEILELTKRLFENVTKIDDTFYSFDPSEAIREGRQIMHRDQLSDFETMRLFKAWFGGDIVFKGYPNLSGNGHVYLAYGNQIAILDSSPHKEDAWTFIRTVFDYRWQLDNLYRFPSNQAALDEYAKKSINVQEEAGSFENAPKLTQSDIDIVIDLINATSVKRGDCDDELLEIITEDMEDYYNGLKSAEDAAKIIQSRASIYISERME